MRIGAGLDLLNLQALKDQVTQGKEGPKGGPQDANPLDGRPIRDPLGAAQKIADRFHDNPQGLQKLIGRMESGGGPRSSAGQLLLQLLKMILELILGGLGQALLGGGLSNFLSGGLGGLLGGGGGGGLFGGGGGGADFSRMRPWSEDDKKFLDQALISEPEQFRDQVSSWRQTTEGNCSSVACIKAAIDRYDNRVFDSVVRGEGGYDIGMQDGYKLNVTDHELSMARSASDFKGGDQALSYAHLCYAAMAKRALQEGHEGARTYDRALRALNNGENPYDTARFLGLKDKTIDVRPDDLNNQDSVVAWSRSHCIFVNRNRDGSHTSDHYGTGYRFNQTDTNGWGLNGAFTFRAREAEANGGGGWGVQPRSHRGNGGGWGAQPQGAGPSRPQPRGAGGSNPPGHAGRQTSAHVDPARANRGGPVQGAAPKLVAAPGPEAQQATPERAPARAVAAQRPEVRAEWTPDPTEPGAVRPTRRVVSAPARQVERPQTPRAATRPKVAQSRAPQASPTSRNA